MSTTGVDDSKQYLYVVLSLETRKPQQIVSALLAFRMTHGHMD